MRGTTRPPRRTGGRRTVAALVFVLTLAALLLPAAACAPTQQQIADGHDPLRALTSAADSRLYDLAFWARVERAGGPLWRQAVAFCAPHAESAYPNCRSVRMAGWWSTPALPTGGRR
jgi:hypothetical protein